MRFPKKTDSPLTRMNPAYAQVRFRAELPLGGLPERFGIVTAWNPEGLPASPEANQADAERLAARVESLGIPAFPVTGGSADFSHAEPGLGLLTDQAQVIALGREFRQEAVFWVERGRVHLCSCLESSGQMELNLWNRLATAAAAHPTFHFQGSPHLLDTPATAFLCSTQCPGDSILAAYAWARRQCDEEGTVISGFHTPVEQDVLAILARRGARILWVPARDLPKKLPAILESPAAENRLLILTPFDYGQPSRSTRESCSLRNQFILRTTPDRYLAHVAPGSSLENDLNLSASSFASMQQPIPFSP